MSAGDTLRKAADLIAVHGLANEVFTDPDGRICAMEAIWRAATGATGTPNAAFWHRAVLDGSCTLDQHNAYRWAIITMRNWIKVHTTASSVSGWSDAHSADEVIEGLRRAAEEDGT